MPTASAFSLPLCTSDKAETMGAKNQSMRPAIVSFRASGVPLNGTCCACRPAAKRKTSAFMCVAEPLPAEP